MDKNEVEQIQAWQSRLRLYPIRAVPKPPVNPGGIYGTLGSIHTGLHPRPLQHVTANLDQFRWNT